MVKLKLKLKLKSLTKTTLIATQTTVPTSVITTCSYSSYAILYS